MCDALDDDDDEDGIIDANDCAPLDDSDWDDTDNDQICDGQDDDDDGDGVSDVNEIACSSNPKDNASLPLDSDSDGECDSTDGDDDGDGYDDVSFDVGYDEGFYDGEETGDVNHSGELTVTDIVIIIENILNGD